MNLLLETLDNLIQEVTAIKDKVIRRMHLKIKRRCPEGFKYNPQTHNCDKMSMVEQRMRSKAALRGVKVKRKDIFGQDRAIRLRAKSIKKGMRLGIYDGLKTTKRDTTNDGFK